jgi:outer membrane murein-binding lipoprotein Lpp
MGKLLLVFMMLAIVALSGCEDSQRLARLEKENQTPKAQLNQLNEKNVTRNYDLEARCSKDAKAWFHENYPRDKDTALLDFTNHYHLATNQCFVLVELHLGAGAGRPFWVNDMSLWNVYENSQYGHFMENHNFDKDSTNEVIACEMTNAKCTTIDQFNALVQPYMNN